MPTFLKRCGLFVVYKVCEVGGMGLLVYGLYVLCRWSEEHVVISEAILINVLLGMAGLVGLWLVIVLCIDNWQAVCKRIK